VFEKISTKAVVPNPFVTADRSTFDKFTAARECSRNSVSMGRIDQSHAQKASGVTSSIYFVISRPGTGSWAGVVDHCPNESMLRICVWHCFGYTHIRKTQCM